MTVGTIDQWVVNAAEPASLARFWALVLGGEPVDRDDGWALIEGDPDTGRSQISFQPDPAPKTGRNRLHLDVRVTDIAAATEVVVGHGAVPVGGAVTDEQGSFQVLRDPEGNEFCLVAPVPR